MSLYFTMLTFQHLLSNGQIPSGSFTVIDNKVYLDVGTLIGESVGSLNSARAIEMCLKLLLAGNLAQTNYNLTALVGQRLNSFSDPVSGTAQMYSNISPPGYYSTMQCTITGLIPAEINNVTAVLQ